MFGSAAPLSSEKITYHHQPSQPSQQSQSSLETSRAGGGADVLSLPTRTAGAPPPVQSGHRHPLELHLLGGFRLLVGGEIANVGRTGQRVLAAVACRGRQATRSQIAHALWPDSTNERAHANLRTALYRLYRRAPGAIHVTSSYIQLTVGMRIDFEQSSRLATRILGSDGSNDRALLNDALEANLHDDLLPDWDDEWLADHQYRYRQLRITALETLSTHLAAAGHHGAAVQAALAAVQADTLRDSAHGTLIRACLAQGNRHEAYTHYTAYRRVLRDELGLEPPADLGRLLTSA
jgi:DNA-binding SARP family transcriptional activator